MRGAQAGEQAGAWRVRPRQRQRHSDRLVVAVGPRIAAPLAVKFPSHPSEAVTSVCLLHPQHATPTSPVADPVAEDDTGVPSHRRERTRTVLQETERGTTLSQMDEHACVLVSDMKGENRQQMEM